MSGVDNKSVSADEDGLRLDRWFRKHYPNLPQSRLQKLARTGQVRVDGKRVKPADRLSSGQSVRVPPMALNTPQSDWKPKPIKASASPEDLAMIRASVIFEDEMAVAINKPAGLASQGGTNTTRHVDGLMAALAGDNERPKLVHRLDRDTSGVLLLAKTGKAAAALTQSFRDRSARKVYWAIIAGVPKVERGRIDLALKKAGARGSERMVWDDQDNGDKASTDYAVLEKAGRFASLVAMMPLTGRTHQLRAHMAAIGHPILGDGKYGGEKSILPGMKLPRGMLLHARSLDLPAPNGRGRLFIEADPSQVFTEALGTFNFNPYDLPDPFIEAGR
ncbi:MAG: RluA family pseudouridine synthase [Rhodospirillales bacterium]